MKKTLIFTLVVTLLSTLTIRNFLEVKAASVNQAHTVIQSQLDVPSEPQRLRLTDEAVAQIQGGWSWDKRDCCVFFGSLGAVSLSVGFVPGAFAGVVGAAACCIP
jgi:hypothetical protein